MPTPQIEIRIPATAPRYATIGTSKDCHVRIIDDSYVSPVHAHVYRVAAGLFDIVDAGSTNGTRVMRGLNEYRLRAGAAFRLVRGDTVVVGRTLLPWSADLR